MNDSRFIFSNAAVFDGVSAELRRGQTVVVEEGRIVEVVTGPASVAADQVIDVAGRTLMPGLIDLHAHPCLADVRAPRAVTMQTEEVALYAAKILRQSLMRGFTTLRDAGGTDAIYRRLIEDGTIEGPRLYPSGRFITMTGGHGDMRDPSDRAPVSCCGGALHERFLSIADGPDEVRKAVREELRRGATQIKMFLSGGVMSPTGFIDQLQYTPAEIRAAVEEAEAQRAYVLAHCHPDGAIRRAAECGVRSIEHASFITEDTARFVAEKGCYTVPTLAVAKALQAEGERIGISAVNRAKLEGVFEPMLKSLEYMKRAGVKMGFGTDVSGQLQYLQCSEFSLRAEVLTPHDILVSATSVAAEIMRQDGRLGVIAPGAHADILVVDGNPLDDIRILDQDGARLSVIMKAGRLHKKTI
jgi:imidazolonepropionase-like amidohydrolase